VAEAFFQGREVIIVPDADGINNWMVFRQAMQCRTFLRRLGVNAHVAAPPFDPADVDILDLLQGSGRNAPGYDTKVMRSTDHGATWSQPSDGTVGVPYYDFRNNTAAPGVPTDQWFVHCHRGSAVDCTNQMLLARILRPRVSGDVPPVARRQT
jgi:hypothetical protein